MPETKIASAERSDQNVFKDFSVASQITDGPTEQGRNIWNDEAYYDYLGYYKDPKTPEITAIIDSGAAWTGGKGYKADAETTLILDSIRGNGFDSFNDILRNACAVMEIGGNFYAEIIRDKEENLINLRPLDPGMMQHEFNSEGVMTGFTQRSKTKGKKGHFFSLEKIFYLQRNRIADEMHGTGIIQKLKLILDMKNEALADLRIINHRYAYPRWIYHLDTDDPTEIAAFKIKGDKANANGENIYIPKDVVVPELMAVAENAKINLLASINYLDNLFYQVGKVPKIVVGGSSEFTEKAGSIVYLSFQQNVEAKQLFIEEQVLLQLNLVIELEFPVSLENELLTDKAKDGPENIDDANTTAGRGQ